MLNGASVPFKAIKYILLGEILTPRPSIALNTYISSMHGVCIKQYQIDECA